MIEIITLYRTSDGTDFETYPEALSYEGERWTQKLTRVRFFNCLGTDITNVGMALPTIAQETRAIYIPKGKPNELVEEFFDDYGYSVVLPKDDITDWRLYRYNDRCDEWENVQIAYNDLLSTIQALGMKIGDIIGY
jgi:hypothetical protein